MIFTTVPVSDFEFIARVTLDPPLRTVFNKHLLFARHLAAARPPQNQPITGVLGGSFFEHTGEDAVRLAASFRPDIALLGVVMQDMGGIEAGIKLLEICPGTKIVLVSESVPPETLERLDAQGYHFETLAAPFSPEELHAVVFGVKAK